jgi:hypothetical protein
MEENNNRHIENHFEAGSNCQVFNGNVTSCVFAMPGSTVIQQVPPAESTSTDEGEEPVIRPPRPSGTPPNLGGEEDTDDELPSAEEMAAACEVTKEEALWWGNASWSVAYRIYCIFGYKGNEETFIEEVKGWPFKNPFNYICNRHALSRPLQRGRINGPLEKWAANGASKREVKLGERLMEILS